jgi:hypothetical protein
MGQAGAGKNCSIGCLQQPIGQRLSKTLQHVSGLVAPCQTQQIAPIGGDRGLSAGLLALQGDCAWSISVEVVLAPESQAGPPLAKTGIQRKSIVRPLRWGCSSEGPPLCGTQHFCLPFTAFE